MSIEDDIRSAIRKGATLSNVGELIRTEPILSSHGDGKEVARLADYAPDPKHENDFIEFWELKDFVYWKLQDEQTAPSIVGIAWNDHGQSTIFYATVLPPG